MKEKNKGAISIFALLSMMFFLIFIMVAYSNVVQKGKIQVQTEEILVDYYKKEQTAHEIIASKTSSTLVTTDNAATYLKEEDQQNQITEENDGKYVFSNGKIYQIEYSE